LLQQTLVGLALVLEDLDGQAPAGEGHPLFLELLLLLGLGQGLAGLEHLQPAGFPGVIYL